MPNPIKKEDIKKALTEALEPFAGTIKEDFNRVDERFNRIDQELTGIKSDVVINKINIQEGFKETKTE